MNMPSSLQSRTLVNILMNFKPVIFVSFIPGMSRACRVSVVTKPIFVVVDSIPLETFNYLPVRFDKNVLLPDPS